MASTGLKPSQINPKPKPATLSILLIDDTDFWQFFIQRLLLSVNSGLQIHTLKSAEECQIASSKWKYDLVICDHFLGASNRMTGIQFWKSLRDKNILTPFLLISGLDQAHFQSLIGEELAPPIYFEKPFNKVSFQNCIHRFLIAQELKVSA